MREHVDLILRQLVPQAAIDGCRIGGGLQATLERFTPHVLALLDKHVAALLLCPRALLRRRAIVLAGTDHVLTRDRRRHRNGRAAEQPVALAVLV